MQQEKKTKYAVTNPHRSHRGLHKNHSQPSVSLWTVGTLPPHHLRMLFITVWQHVSFRPRHYDIRQPGWSQNCKTTVPKNKILGKNSTKPALRPWTHSICGHEWWMRAATARTKAPAQASLSFPCRWPRALPIIGLLSVWHLCSAFEKSSAPDTCHQETSHKSLSAPMTE